MSKPVYRLIRVFALLLPVLSAQAQTGTMPPRPNYPPLEEFQEIIIRPLFEESRRPPPDEEAPNISTTAKELRDSWRLTGVVWEGEQQLALFSARQGNQRSRLRLDMYLDSDWQLADIQTEAVVLTDGAQQVRLELREPRLLPDKAEPPIPKTSADKPVSRETTDMDADNNNQG